MNARLSRAWAAALALALAGLLSPATPSHAQQRPRRVADTYSETTLTVTIPPSAPENPEVAEAAEAFGTLGREELRLWLSTVMPAPPAPAARAKVASDFTRAMHAARPAALDDDALASRVAAALAPTLKFFNRSNLSVAVVPDPEPRVELVLGAGLVVTTGMLDAAGEADRLNGWVAHALAAETSLPRYARADRADDFPELRRITLERDAIAAAALAAVGMRPSLYAESVFAVITADARRARAHSGAGHLPSLRDRLRVVEMVADLTAGRAAPPTLLVSNSR